MFSDASKSLRMDERTAKKNPPNKIYALCNLFGGMVHKKCDKHKTKFNQNLKEKALFEDNLCQQEIDRARLTTESRKMTCNVRLSETNAPRMDETLDRMRSLQEENEKIREENQHIQWKITAIAEDCLDFVNFVDYDCERKLEKKRDTLKALIVDRDSSRQLLQEVKDRGMKELEDIENEYFIAKNAINKLEVENQRINRSIESLERQKNALNEQCGLAILDNKVLNSKNANLAEDIVRTQSDDVVELFQEVQYLEMELKALCEQNKQLEEMPEQDDTQFDIQPCESSSESCYDDVLDKYESLVQGHMQLEHTYEIKMQELVKIKEDNLKMEKIIHSNHMSSANTRHSAAKFLEKMKILNVA